MERMTDSGRIVAISISTRKGVPKTNVPEAWLVEDWGIEGDAHAGKWSRQVSLLAVESIDKMRSRGLAVGPGAFAENITTQYLAISRLAVGTRIRIGGAELELTQIGKECHARCAIFQATGDCVMPKEGIFARVVAGGLIRVGDPVQVVE